MANIEFVQKYFTDIGISGGASSLEQCFNMIGKCCGKEYKKKIRDSILNRSSNQRESKNTSDNTFYELKNESLEKSLCVSNAFEGTLLRDFCKWIYENKECFLGDTILEIGCDTGIISCFLARLFPNKKILSIDRVDSAVQNAKKLSQKLNLSNIEFMTTDLKALLESEFDTVLSIRTVHENLDVEEACGQGEYLFLPFIKGSESFLKYYKLYAENIRKHLAKNGRVISIERLGIDPNGYAWMRALNENQFRIDKNKSGRIETRELNTKSSFCFYQATDTNCSLDGQSLFDDYIWINYKYLPMDQYQWTNWAGATILEYKKREFIKGYKSISPIDNKVYCKYDIWTDSDGDLLVEQHVDGQGWLIGNTLKTTECEMLKMIENNKINDENNGFIVKEFKCVNGEEIYIS